MRCCESTSEERRAGNLHAAFCGSRRWVTASGDPVPGWVTSRGDPATSRWMTIFPSVNTRLDRPRHEISFNSALAL